MLFNRGSVLCCIHMETEMLYFLKTDIYVIIANNVYTCTYLCTFYYVIVYVHSTYFIVGQVQICPLNPVNPGARV